MACSLYHGRPGQPRLPEQFRHVPDLSRSEKGLSLHLRNSLLRRQGQDRPPGNDQIPEAALLFRHPQHGLDQGHGVSLFADHLTDPGTHEAVTLLPFRLAPPVFARQQTRSPDQGLRSHVDFLSGQSEERSRSEGLPLDQRIGRHREARHLSHQFFRLGPIALRDVDPEDHRPGLFLLRPAQGGRPHLKPAEIHQTLPAHFDLNHLAFVAILRSSLPRAGFRVGIHNRRIHLGEPHGDHAQQGKHSWNHVFHALTIEPIFMPLARKSHLFTFISAQMNWQTLRSR